MSRLPYEPPTVKLIGNLHDLLRPAPRGAPAPAQACRLCGCTDSRPCILDAARNVVEIADGAATLPLGFTTCSWIEPDLCSGCVVDEAPPMLFDGDGNPIGRAP